MNSVKVKNIIIDKVKGLPTLPGMIHKVLALVQDEDTSARTLGNLIAYDQAISSRLLKVANSAYYGFMRGIATVQHAIVILGFKEVKSLTLGITVFNTINKTNKESSITHEELWMHSIGCALAGQIICKKEPGVDAETIFTAALLHDIGKLVLDNYFTQEYGKVLEKVQLKGISMVEAEEEVMGFTHADVGGFLCDRWKFPPMLVSPIRLHHQLEEVDAEHMQITSVVHLADILCKRAHIGNGGDNKIPPLHSLAKEHLKLEESDLDTIVEELKQEEEKVKSFLRAIQ
jgi:putative nucleotidyltransferase with HDIG domain